MATEQYLHGTSIESDFNGHDASFGKWKSMDSMIEESETNSSGGFECNICLDLVRDPVVTFCGHLYCWPCIYKWISFQDVSPENPDQKQPQCPVCKAEVSQKTLIPLYGRGADSSKDDGAKLGTLIPERPSSPRYGTNTLLPNVISHYTYPVHRRGYVQPSRPYQPENYTASSPMLGFGASSTQLVDPMIGMFGEMVYARIFGNRGTNLPTYPNSYRFAGSSGNARLRRHMIQTDKSLSRVCFFLFCCVILCLLLF